MYQIDVASAAATLPAPAAAGTPGYFTEGNPVSGVAATVVPADFLNMLMLELLGVLAGAGVAPVKGTNTQLLTAIRGLTSGNLASTGHVSLPVGSLTLIVNWGGGAHSDNTGAQQVQFDQPFPTALFQAVVSNNAGGPPVAFHGANNGNSSGGKVTGMTVYSASAQGVAAAAGTAFRYIAIGF